MKRTITTWLIFFGLGLTNFLSAQNENKIRLNNNWKFVRGDLGGVWEAVRPVKAGNPECHRCR
jgi:beta-galactosidase